MPDEPKPSPTPEDVEAFGRHVLALGIQATAGWALLERVYRDGSFHHMDPTLQGHVRKFLRTHPRNPARPKRQGVVRAPTEQGTP